MRQLFLLFSAPVLAAAGLQQYVAFDAASASSTHSAGNLAGSPAFAAQQALSAGSGYWCSSGSHAPGQSVSWTGVLNSRRGALGVKVDWAYAPGQVKVLTSSDGSNFEESKCWQTSARTEVAYEESFMFDAPRTVKAVTIVMRSAQSWGYFGLNSAALIAQPGPFMLVSGITSAVGEQCLVTGAGGVHLEPCLGAIAGGDGREVLQQDEDGRIVNLADGTCLFLADGDTTGGGLLTMEPCSTSVESGDGRGVFAMTPSGQVKMPQLGNYCLTMAGDSAADTDVAQVADVTATSSNAQHAVEHVADGDAQSYWASGPDPASPVDVQLDFGATKQIKAVEIDWEHPAQAFELQMANGGKWATVFGTSGNNLQTTKYVGPIVSGTALRIHMTQPHPTLGSSDGHAVYGIRGIRVLAASARTVVQDCAEAEDNTDAREKFFMVAVPEFDPAAASAAKANSALLQAAEAHLGNSLSELYVAMPALAACGFKASFGKHPVEMLTERVAAHIRQSTRASGDEASAAVAAIGPSIGVDMTALRSLVVSTRSALAEASR